MTEEARVERMGVGVGVKHITPYPRSHPEQLQQRLQGTRLAHVSRIHVLTALNTQNCL